MSYDYYITNALWIYHRDENEIKRFCVALSRYNRYITNSYYDSDDDFDVTMEKYRASVAESIERENEKTGLTIYENGEWTCEKYRLKYSDIATVYLDLDDITKIVKFTTAHAKDPNSKLEVPILT